MKSISESEYMVPEAQDFFEAAAEMVRDLPDEVDPQGIRCHELARAVHDRLCRLSSFADRRLQVVDGRYDRVDHSWIYIALGSGYVLDVYTVGRLPQVQLVQSHSLLQGTRALYEAGHPRQDIRKKIVEAMVGAMQSPKARLKLMVRGKAREKSKARAR